MDSFCLAIYMTCSYIYLYIFAYSALVVFKNSAENKTGFKAELVRSEPVSRYKLTAVLLLAGLC